MIKTLLVNGVVIFLITIVVIASTPFNSSMKALFEWLFFSFAPTLLPLMLLQSILFITNGFTLLAFILQRPSALIFGVNGFFAVIIVVAIIGGFPMTTIVTAQFIYQGKITKEQGLNLMYHLMFPSFSFLNGVLHLSGNLMAIMWVPSIIFLRLGNAKTSIQYISWTEIQSELNSLPNIQSFGRSLMSTIKGSIMNLVNVSGIIIFFAIPTYFLLNYVPRPINYWISSLLDFSRPSYLYLLYAPTSFDKAVSLAMLPLGGLSMWMQVIVLYPYNFSSSKFLQFRILYAFLTFLGVLVMF